MATEKTYERFSRREDRLTREGKNLRTVWVLGLLLTALFPMQAYAAVADTLGQLVCNIRENYTPISDILSVLTYTVGAVFGVRGALMLKAYSENPGNNPIHKGIWHLAAAGALISFPGALSTLRNSLGLSGLGTPVACEAGAVVSAASSGGLDKMMQNFVNNISNPLMTTVSAISILVGLTMIFRGLMRASKTGTDPQGAAPHKILAHLIIGAILVSIGNALSNVIQTLFGDANIIKFPGINWSTIAGDTTDTKNIDATVQAVLLFVQVIGAISFLRGWMVMKSAVEGGGQATVPQGLAHIIGGTMAINIGGMLEIFDKTFGLELIKNGS